SDTTSATCRDEATRTRFGHGFTDGKRSLTVDLVLDRALVGQDVALVDPDLDTDTAGCRASLAIRLTAGHLGAAEATGALDLHAERSSLLHRLDRALHCTAEADPSGEL